MAPKKLTLDQKLHNALKRQQDILSKYENSRTLLMDKGLDYRRFKNPNLKSAYNDYRNLLRTEKTIKDIQKIVESPQKVLHQ